MPMNERYPAIPLSRLGADPAPEPIEAFDVGSASVDAKVALDPEDCQRTPCPISRVGDPAFT
jgi:hypothetical protein